MRGLDVLTVITDLEWAAKGNMTADDHKWVAKAHGAISELIDACGQATVGSGGRIYFESGMQADRFRIALARCRPNAEPPPTATDSD